MFAHQFWNVWRTGNKIFFRWPYDNYEFWFSWRLLTIHLLTRSIFFLSCIFVEVVFCSLLCFDNVALWMAHLCLKDIMDKEFLCQMLFYYTWFWDHRNIIGVLQIFLMKWYFFVPVTRLKYRIVSKIYSN